MSLYHDLIIDLYKHPVNKFVMKDATHTHSGANITCGDRVRVFIKIHDGVITDASFEGLGCAISIAAASLVTEEAKGQSFKDIRAWDVQKIFELLGTPLTPTRVKCGMLALETMQQALQK